MRLSIASFYSIILFQCFIFLFSNVSKAQKAESDDKTLSPYFVVISEHPETDNLPLKETSAKVNIVGVIADVTVKQVYVNTGKNKLEAIYTFPLSTKAAVYSMQMTIGKRIITAKIEEKQKARKDYETAKAQGKRTSLLEQSRPNVFTMNVANIVVGDTIVVELKYTELLVPEKGQYSFVYPTVVGPRYSNKSKENTSPDDNFVNTPYTKSGVMPTYKYNMDVKIHSSIPIQNIVCETHKVTVAHPDLQTVTVKLDPNEFNGGNRDFIIDYSLQGDKIESGLMVYEDKAENFFLLMVQPPKKIIKEQIPPREYIFIVDVSGSMHGFPLDVLKTLLRNLILNLKPTDKFNVLLFSGSTGLLSPTSLDANQNNIDKAVRFIDAQSGGGGTELLPALKQAFALPQSDPDISRSFVIVTDGYIDVEKEAFDFIRTNTGAANFFSFGIGSDVNRYLIEGMAFVGNGEPMIITSQDKAAKQAEKFRSYINTPVLTRIKTNYSALQVYDVVPTSIPDMLAERPIIIFGKYKGNAQGKITIKGKVGRKAYTQTFDASTATSDTSFSAIKYLWARDKIKLLDYYTNNGYKSDSTVIKQITNLGLKYNLMTNYTSFLAIDEEIIKDPTGKWIRVKQAIPLPQNVSDNAVGYDASAIRVPGINSMPSISRDMADIVVIEKEIDSDEHKIYTKVEAGATFPRGYNALRKFIQENIQYPETLKNSGIKGTVKISFKIESDGSLSDIKIKKSVHPLLDAEAIRVIKLMPKWNPKTVNGKAVSSVITIPIKFNSN